MASPLKSALYLAVALVALALALALLGAPQADPLRMGSILLLCLALAPLGWLAWQRPAPPPAVAPPPPAAGLDAHNPEDVAALAEVEIALARREAALRQAQAQVHELEDRLAEAHSRIVQPPPVGQAHARLEEELARLGEELARRGEELEGRRSQVEHLRRDNTLRGEQVARLKTDLQHREQELERLRGEKRELERLLEVAQRGAAGMSQLGAELGQAQRARAELEERLQQAELALEEARSSVDPFALAEGLGLPALTVDSAGWIVAATPALGEALDFAAEDVVGLDVWSLWMELLGREGVEFDEVLGRLALSLDEVDKPHAQLLPRAGGRGLARLALPLGEGAGRVEIYSPLDGKVVADPARVTEALRALEQVVASAGGGPSAKTTLSALGRQLDALGPTVAGNGAATELVSTARALHANLWQGAMGTPADARTRAATQELEEALGLRLMARGQAR